MINYHKVSTIFLSFTLFCTHLFFGMDPDLLRIREQRQGNEQTITMQTSDGRELNLPGMLTLEANDGTNYQVPTEYCLLSVTIRNMLEVCHEDGTIPLQGLTGEQMTGAIELLGLIYHFPSLDQLRELLSQKEIKDLISLLHISEYLDVSELGNSVCDALANRLIEPGLIADFIQKPNLLREIGMGNLGTHFSQQLGPRIINIKRIHSMRAYLLRKCSIPCIKVLCCQSEMNSVYFNRAGDKAVSTSDYGTIIIWDIETGKCLKTLNGLGEHIKDSKFNHDGTLVVSGSTEGTVRIWDVGTGVCLKMLNGHTGGVNYVNFNHDGSLVASASKDHTVRIWNTETGECIKILNDHTAGVNSVVFNGAGDRLASASNDGTIRVWNTAAWECMHVFDNHTIPKDAKFNRECDLLICCGKNATLPEVIESHSNSVYIWDIETESIVHLVDYYSILSISLHPKKGDTILISRSSDGVVNVEILDIRTGESLHKLPSYVSFARSYAPLLIRLITYAPSFKGLRFQEISESLFFPSYSACFNEAGDKIIFIFRSPFLIGVVDLKLFNELDHFLQQEITVEQALLLACIHKAMTCNLPLDFGNHPYLSPHFESLPQAIQDILRQEQMLTLPVGSRLKSAIRGWLNPFWKH